VQVNLSTNYRQEVSFSFANYIPELVPCSLAVVQMPCALPRFAGEAAWYLYGNKRGLIEN